MIRRSSLIAAEVILGLMAAVLIGLGVAWWRLSQGPVELAFIKEHVQSELSRARSGRPVGIERVELAWSRAGGALELHAIGVTMQDAQGKVVSRFEDTRIELSALPLLIGQVTLEQADFSGGQVTIDRKRDGSVHVAFGPPGTPPDIVIPARPSNENLEQRVARLLDGLADAFRPIGPGGKLRSVSVHGAELAINDEGGGSWRADSANFELARVGDQLALVADARLEGPQGLAPATLRITTDTAFQSALVEFGAQNVRPRALLSPAALGPFAGLDAPLTAQISVGLDRTTGINRIEGEATLGRGVAEMGDGQFNVTGGRLRGRYDVAGDELIIDEMNLAGARTRIRGEIRVRQASAILRAEPGKPAPFTVALPAMTLDAPGVFSEQIQLANVQAEGAIDAGERSIRFTRLHARADNSDIDASGRIYWAAAQDGRVRQGVELDAAIGGVLDARTVLRLWPIGLGEGARAYLAESLRSGRVSDASVKLDVRPSDAAAEQWREEAVDIRFNLADAEMRFISTMPPIVRARASAVLRGNSFNLQVQDARFNDLAVTRGSVEMPRLKPRGSPAIINARVEGDARRILEVLQQRPLNLRDRLPVDVASVTGRGQVTLRMERPMLANVPFEDYKFRIDGTIDNLAGNMTTRRVALSQGRLEVRGDQRSIRVAGPIRAGSSDVQVAWTEYLNRPNQASSEYEFSGNFDADDLVRLGYSLASYAQGRIGVTVTGQGRGFDVDHANVQLELRAAAVESPWRFYTKRAGVPASARFDIVRGPDNSLVFNNLDARGVGFLAQGRVRAAHDGRILEADLTRLTIEGRSDARVTAQRAADGGLDIQVRGALFDGAPFMDGDNPPGVQPVAAPGQPRPQRIDEPLVRATVAVDRLKLRGGATLSNARVSVTAARGALALLLAEGRSPSDKAFSLALGARPDDPSGGIRMQSDDAGFAMRALTGAENIVGGTASAEGDWRPGPPTLSHFTVRLRDFQVVRLPAMAQLLSSAGSLTGLVEVLNGDGIGFTQLDAPMTYTDGHLRINEARMAGPSLGFTASGGYNMNADNLSIDGVVVPSYGLNSIWGGLPIVGDLLVSRRGEGVIGIQYSMRGKVAEPRVGVNPLSALTPGILRRIFEPSQPRQNTTTPPRRQAPPRPARRQPSNAGADETASAAGVTTAAAQAPAP